MTRHDRTAALGVVRALSQQLPDAEEYVMVHHPAFRVGKKPYVIVGLGEDGARVMLSVNLGPASQPYLLEDERFTKTPYLGRHGWVSVGFDAVSKEELKTLLVDSYRRCANRKQLALLDAATSSSAARGGAKHTAPRPRAGRARSPRSGAASAAAVASSPSSDAEWKALGLAAPARRALIGAGFTGLLDLRGTTLESLRELHGMGPTALELLRVALASTKRKTERRFVRESKRSRA
jgi:predicted DNA-binding protein (MmcQ/YjbR family)